MQELYASCRVGIPYTALLAAWTHHKTAEASLYHCNALESLLVLQLQLGCFAHSSSPSAANKVLLFAKHQCGMPGVHKH